MSKCTRMRGSYPSVLAFIAVAATLSDAPAHAGPAWGGYAGDPQHTALSSVASNSLDRILWQTPVDEAPQFSGNDLLIHYGSPLITQADPVIVPVKTGANGGFEVQARNGVDGSLKWSQTTDYILPPHRWTPSLSPALTPNGRLYLPGAGGRCISVTIRTRRAARRGESPFWGMRITRRTRRH